MTERGCPWGNIPSAKRNKDQDMLPVIQGCIPGGFIDKDVHYKRAEEMGARNI